MSEAVILVADSGADFESQQLEAQVRAGGAIPGGAIPGGMIPGGATARAATRGRVTSEGAADAPAAAGTLWICWVEPDGSPRREPLQGIVSLGAHPQNSVVIDDPSASGFHCRMHRRPDGRLWLRDLDSRNGTLLDGVRVTEAELLPGATLRAGGRLFRIEREQENLAHPEMALPGLVSRDPAMREPLSQLRRAAPSDLPILLRGESGSGKEVAARAIHELSRRARGPFVPLNCGAISPELAEAELFGHERGAFTGASGTSVGAFGAADCGTLFLDEIGDLPLALQVKLLRALESSEVKPVGAARPRRVDVRIVCATHRDVRALVRSGAFREDLYYRLRGAVIELPPLRARPRDILPLAEHFLAEARPEPGCGFAPDARAALLAWPWPGNARELRHAVRLALVLRESRLIRAADLRLDEPEPPAYSAAPCVNEAPTEPRAASTPGTAGAAHSASLAAPAALRSLHSPESIELRGRRLDELEALAIRSSYLRHNGTRRLMVEELGIARSSLLRKLTALGLRGG